MSRSFITHALLFVLIVLLVIASIPNLVLLGVGIIFGLLLRVNVPKFFTSLKEKYNV